MHELVLVGGWAAWVYANMANAARRQPVLLTHDIDIAVASSVASGATNVGELLRQADFVDVIVGPESKPPVTRYQHVRHPVPATTYCEFLTDYSGPPGRPQTRVVSGIVAQKLRFMSLALIKPMTIQLATLGVPDLPRHGIVRVPHPMNYIVHKLLTVPRRARASDQAKDHAYLYQVVLATHPGWQEMRERLEHLASVVPTRWIDRAQHEFAQRFCMPHSSGPSDAAAVLASVLNPAPTPESVQRVMNRAGRELGLITNA